MREHPFFASIDWRMAEEKKLVPPIKPSVNSADDCTNFDTEFLKEEINETPFDKIKVGNENKYEGFSYAVTADITKDIGA